MSFDEILAANAEFAKAFKSSDLTGRAAEGLAIVTCMDSRIDPLRVVGMKPGDAKNAQKPAENEQGEKPSEK